MKSITVLFILLNCFKMSFLFSQNKPDSVNLKIIVTTDVHGAIFPYDFIDDKPISHSLAQVLTYVNEQRNLKEQEVVFLDNGDILQGQPVVYNSNFINTKKKHVCAAVMNYMGYGAATIGNHDIEAGHAVYDKLIREFNFPWLAANAIRQSTNQPYFKPYTILSKKGIKIAILGLMTPAIPTWLPHKIWEGMQFDDMVESAKYWVKTINENEKPDVIVGIFHSGMDYTYNNQNESTLKNENATKLVATKVPGFDAVFGGHDHQLFNVVVKNSENKEVLLIDSKNSAQLAGVAKIKLKWDKTSKSYSKKVSGEIIEVTHFKPDVKFMNEFKDYFEETKNFVSENLGTFTTTVSSRESMFGNSAFIDLVQKIQLEITKADISFADPLSFDATIHEGNVYVRDMFKLYKFENLLYTMELTGQEIKDYLEYSYGNWFNQMKDENDHLISFKINPQTGKEQTTANFFNYSSAAGIIYIVDVSKPKGEKVKIISMSDGRSFDLTKKYKVAVNSYRGNGGGGHLITGSKIPKGKLSDRVIFSTDKDLRYYLIEWIKMKKTITPVALKNWTVIPETWWKKGKERDYQILYKE